MPASHRMVPLDLCASATAYLQDCFARESPPRVSEFAARLRVSQRALNKHFKSTSLGSAAEFFKLVQIKVAKQLLCETGLTVTQVGYRAGFGTRRTFHRAFLSATGMTPAVYRRCAKCP